MNTNKHEWFCGEAALECPDTSGQQYGFVAVNLPPLSGIRLALMKFCRFLACLADESE